MRKQFWAVLLIVALIAAACGPALQPNVSPETESGEVFMIALPRIVVDVNGAGTPSVAGLDVAQVAQLAGQDISRLRVPPAVVARATSANLQHIEMRQTGSGLLIFVNGKPLPHVGWSDASLQKAGDLAGMLNLGRDDLVSTVRRVAPIVRRLGLDLVLRFPRQAASSEIAMASFAEAPRAAQPITTTASPSLIVKFEVKYNPDGVPGILGVSGKDLEALGLKTTIPNLDASTIQNLQTRNIQSVEVRGKTEGLYLYINNEPLPNLVWDGASLQNVAELYGQLEPGSSLIELMRQVLPLVQSADIGVLVHFPVAPERDVRPRSDALAGSPVAACL